jgi:hypothetical protein
VGASGPAPSGAETEAELIQHALQAEGSRPAEALALTDIHAARFPFGALGEEREIIALRALHRLGRDAEARPRAARYLAKVPKSVYRSSLVHMFPDLESSAGDHKDSTDSPSTP